MKIKYISDDYELYLIQQRYSFQYDLIIDCISKKIISQCIKFRKHVEVILVILFIMPFTMIIKESIHH